MTSGKRNRSRPSRPGIGTGGNQQHERGQCRGGIPWVGRRYPPCELRLHGVIGEGRRVGMRKVPGKGTGFVDQKKSPRCVPAFAGTRCRPNPASATPNNTSCRSCKRPSSPAQLQPPAMTFLRSHRLRVNFTQATDPAAQNQFRRTSPRATVLNRFLHDRQTAIALQVVAKLENRRDQEARDNQDRRFKGRKPTSRRRSAHSVASVSHNRTD